MPCRRQCSTSFFSRRGLVWATNQRNLDTGRRILEKFLDVNTKLVACVRRRWIERFQPRVNTARSWAATKTSNIQ